jgi:hypothetical protein
MEKRQSSSPSANGTENLSAQLRNPGSAVANLVAVRWFDRFGIERIAVDCSLFDGESKLQSGFVTLLSGESL